MLATENRNTLIKTSCDHVGSEKIKIHENNSINQSESIEHHYTLSATIKVKPAL